MAPKAKKAGAKNASNKAEEEHDEPLQAIVLADAHQTTFSPFSAQTPRCLLPLVGVPLIEYTLHALAGAGVDEVYIVSGNHPEEFEQYIAQSGWKGDKSPFSDLTIIRSSPFGTVGDVMRDMDKRAVLKNDFFVVYGDLISNLPLDTALAAHRKRKALDKNAIMTVVLKETGAGPESRKDAPIFVIDPRKNRCLHYEEMDQDSTDHFIAMETDILAESNQFEIRADLLDCGIDICTPDALALWSDNFDFQTPRQNFLYQVLKDYELNGKTIHIHVYDSHYAARVSNLKAYDTVSKQIISRWTYPFCPDSNLYSKDRFQMSKGQRYQDQNVHLSRTCTIGPKTVLSADTRVGDFTKVTTSVIGRRCAIGRNVTIENSYIWDDTVIRDGATIKNAIIASGCTIGKESIVEPGALISFGVQIADKMIVKGTSRIACVKRHLTSEIDELQNLRNDESLVGKGGKGAEFVSHDPDDISSSQTQVTNLIYNLEQLSLSNESFSDPDEVSDEEDDSDFDDTVGSLRQDAISHHRRPSTAESILSISSDQEASRATRTAEADFHHEAVAGLLESLQRGDEASNVQLELTSLRMTANQSEHAVRRALVTAFMRHISSLVHDASPPSSASASNITTTGTTTTTTTTTNSGNSTTTTTTTTLKKGYSDTINRTLTPYAPLFKRNLHDHTTAAKHDQVDLLLLFQHDLARRADGDVLLMHTTMCLVLGDVLQAEGVEQWWNSARGTATAELVSVRAKTKAVVEQLVAGSDDDGSEEEESEEDDDDDDDDPEEQDDDEDEDESE